MSKLKAAFVAILIITPMMVFAGEEQGDRDWQGGRGMMRWFVEQMPEDVRAVLQKRKEGKELTAAEEKKFDAFRKIMLDRMREMRERRGNADRGFGRDRRQRGPQTPLFRAKLNPTDAALQTIAEIRIKAQQFDKALEALERMAKSPEEAAQDAAHFNIATLCRRSLGDTDRAIQEYRKVTGDLAPRAWKEIREVCEEMGEYEQGIALLEEILKATEDKADKIKLLHLIAEGWGTHQQPDKSAAALERITKLVPYPEAMKMKDMYVPGEREVRAMSREEQRELRERLDYIYLPFEDD